MEAVSNSWVFVLLGIFLVLSDRKSDQTSVSDIQPQKWMDSKAQVTFLGFCLFIYLLAFFSSVCWLLSWTVSFLVAEKIPMEAQGPRKLSAMIPEEERDSLCPSIHVFNFKKDSRWSSWGHMRISKPIIMAKGMELSVQPDSSVYSYIWGFGGWGKRKVPIRVMWDLWNVFPERKHWY